MALRKYQKTEKADVVSPQGHQAIENELRKAGKTSAKDLTPEERKSVSEAVDKPQ